MSWWEALGSVPIGMKIYMSKNKSSVIMIRLLIDCLSSRRKRNGTTNSNPRQLSLYFLFMFVDDGMEKNAKFSF